MSNKQPRRQRCQPKVYTESDFQRVLRHSLMGIEKHHMEVAIGSFALALHRKLDLSAEQITDVLVAANEYSVNALCFEDVRKELMDEAGVDIGEFTEEML